jgi:hypothetical protein
MMLAVNGNLAGVWLLETGDNACQSTLPGAVVAYKCEDFAGIDVERHI